MKWSQRWVEAAAAYRASIDEPRAGRSNRPNAEPKTKRLGSFALGALLYLYSRSK